MAKIKEIAQQKIKDLPKGNCGNPRCKHTWLIRVIKPIKCPRCGGTNIWIE